MSNKTDKLRKIKKNVLGRYDWNDTQGNSLVNDFLQLSKIAERLKTEDEQAYTAFMSLIKDNVAMKEENVLVV